MKRGEVWWCEEPDDTHPALIISRDEDIERLFDVIAVPLHIDMNPLVRAGGVGEHLDVGLGDRLPARAAQILPDPSGQRREIEVAHMPEIYLGHTRRALGALFAGDHVRRRGEIRGVVEYQGVASGRRG
jgi:hypothetical protein